MGSNEREREAKKSDAEEGFAPDVSRYFPLAHATIEQLGADAVVVFVIGGVYGNGCAPAFRYGIADTPENRSRNTRIVRSVAGVMRAIADRVEQDARAGGIPLEPIQ